MQEKLTLNNVVNVNITYSAWFTVQTESQVHALPTYRLDVNGTFITDLSIYSLSSIHTIEVQMRYRASNPLEKWHLKAYNWASITYGDSGFNNTLGHTPSGNWDYYVINFTYARATMYETTVR